MKLNDALKEKGQPFFVPDCSREDLPEFFVQRGFKVGAEVGVYKAAFTELFAKVGLQIFGIDPWQAEGYEGYSGRQERQDFLFGHAQRVVGKFPNCRLIRKTSVEGAKMFKDESLDFVYLDGNHGFKYIAEDLWEWSKKVRKGGVIAGHDYGHHYRPGIDPYCLHVGPVVDAWTKAMGIKNWFVIGGNKKSDKWKSFLWIKE